jgi:predicted acetyltransferase
VDFELRSIAAGELPAFMRANSVGFGHGVETARRNMADHEIERTVAAFDGERIVAGSRNYTFELTMPGGALLAAAGVSDVSVVPTHRRRGLLRSMMERLLDDAVVRDEPVAMLTASEGGIYGRFGFGVTIRTSTVEVDTRTAEFAAPPAPGTLRLVELDEARKTEPAVFDRARRLQPGAVSRFDSWWLDEQFQSEFGTRFDVLYEASDGSVDGYMTYGMRGQGTIHGPTYRLVTREFVAVSPQATYALFRYACEIDLVRTVVFLNAPLDFAGSWMLSSARAAQQTDVRDFLWTRLLDVPAALGARTYSVPGGSDEACLVLEVHDAFRPGGRADGCFALEAGSGGASVTPTTAEPDLVLDVATLSAAWLGGVAFSTLARAGRIEEVHAGALTRADTMFTSSPHPAAMTWF